MSLDGVPVKNPEWIIIKPLAFLPYCHTFLIYFYDPPKNLMNTWFAGESFFPLCRQNSDFLPMIIVFPHE